MKKQESDIVTGTSGFSNPNEANQYCAGLAGMNKSGFAYHWIIERIEDQSSIGFCNFYLPAPHLVHLKNCEISFWLDAENRQQGYMRESLVTAIDFIFNTEGFARIEAYVSPTNLPSIVLLESLGFIHEGQQRKKWLVDGVRYDMNLYALLKDEYQSRLDDVAF